MESMRSHWLQRLDFSWGQGYIGFLNVGKNNIP